MPEEKKILCHECSKEMDANADECPHCKAPYKVARNLRRALKLAGKMEEAENPKSKEKKSTSLLGGIFGEE